MVKAAACYSQDCGFEAGPLQYFSFCMSCSWQSMYMARVHTWSEHVCSNIHTNTCMFVCIHGLNIVWMKYMHSLLYIHVCTWYIHGIDFVVHMIYMFVHVSSLFITRTWKTILCYQYCLEVYNFVLACTSLIICMYYAIVQEYDFLYVLSSDRYIPP